MPEFNYFAGKPFSISGARSNYLQVGPSPTKEDELRLSKTWEKKKGGRPAPPLDDGRTQRLNGVTMYAGSKIPGFNTTADYVDTRFQRELEEMFKGDLELMATKKAFDPDFMRWKQEKSTGGFAAIRQKARRRRDEIARAKLQSLAFEIKKPLAPSTLDIIKKGLHGTSVAVRTKLDQIAWSDSRAKEAQKYRDEVSLWRLTKQIDAATSEAGKSAIRRMATAPAQEPSKPAGLVKMRRKNLSEEALKVLKLLLDKLEEKYTSLSRGLNALDKGSLGVMKISDFRLLLGERYGLGASGEVVDELVACLDLESSGLVSLSDLQQRLSEAFSWASKGNFSNSIGQGSLDQRRRIRPSTNLDLIHRMARRSLAEKYHELYLGYKHSNPQFPGYVTKGELQLLLKRSNVNLEPEQFSLFFGTFSQSENGAVLWRNFLDSIQPGNGANARKVGGLQDDVFVSRNIERVEIPPYFVEEPDYLRPNHWGLHGTIKHPAGAGYDNRHNIMTYALTTTKRGLNGMARGEIVAIMQRSGLKKPNPDQQVTFQRGADDLSGWKKMKAVTSKEQVEEIMGDGFVPRLSATGLDLVERYRRLSRRAATAMA